MLPAMTRNPRLTPLALTNPATEAAENSTNANSPTCDSANAVRTAVDRLAPNARQMASSSTILTLTTAAISASTRGHSVASVCTSMAMPTARKKSPISGPFRGSTVDTSWYRYSEVERSIPSRNAPRVIDTPLASIAQAAAKTLRNRAMPKASRLRLRAAHSRAAGRTRRPRATTATSARAAMPSLDHAVPSGATAAWCASSGISAITGTILMSWAVSTARLVRP